MSEYNSFLRIPFFSQVFDKGRGVNERGSAGKSLRTPHSTLLTDI